MMFSWNLGRARLPLLATGLMTAFLLGRSMASEDPPASGRASVEPPWSRSESGTGGTPAVGSVRDLFRLYGIDDTDFARFRDDGEVDTDEASVVARLLYRLSRLSPGDLDVYRQSASAWPKILADPAAHRGDVVAVRGEAVRVEKLEVPEPLRTSLEFDSYYAVTLRGKAGGGGGAGDGERAEEEDLTILTRTVPTLWKPDCFPTPASAEGMFLEAGAAGHPSRAVMAAARVAWHPQRTSELCRVSAGLAELGKAGVDVGLFDDVRTGNGRPLLATDRELFYQVLGAAGRHNAATLRGEAPERLDLRRVLVSPTEEQGKLMQVDATARRITKILVGEADLQRRFGIDHYYELDITIPLGDFPVRLQGSDPSKSPVYENTYPATVCVARLPRELERLARDASASPERPLVLNVPIRAVGFFFKIWAYRSEYVSSIDPRQQHLSPLFLGRTVLVLPAPRAPSFSGLTLFFVLLIVGALVVFWLTMAVGHFRERRRRRARLARMPTSLE